MAKQTIGEFLATQRKAKGLTQQYVSEILGVSNKTLSAWETNKAYPDILALPALAELYGVTADEILNGERSTEATAATEISDKAQNRLFKSKSMQYSTRCAILLSIGVCAVVIFGAATLFLDVLLISVPLLIIGIVATAVVYAILIASAKSLVLSVDDEASQLRDNFVLNVTAHCAQTVCVLGVCWLACGIFMIFAVCASWSNFGYLVCFVALPFAIGLISVILAAKYRARAYKTLGTELQKASAKYNNKLLAMCVGFSALAAAALIATEIAVLAAFGLLSSEVVLLLLLAATVLAGFIAGTAAYGCKRKRLKY